MPVSWSAETSLVFPFVGIYLAQASIGTSEHEEFLAGLCSQNWKDLADASGRAHAYRLVLGYRRFLWRGLHLEASLYPAWNSFDSSVDGQPYRGFELWIEYRIGWKVPFSLGRSETYLALQPGIGHALFMSNLWPGLDADSYRMDSLSFIPEAVFGIAF